MRAPQIVFLSLLFLDLGTSLAKDGEPRGNYRFGLSVVSAVITCGLLYWGGFFGGR